MSATLRERVSGAVDSVIDRFYGSKTIKKEELQTEALIGFFERGKKSIQVVTEGLPVDFYTNDRVLSVFKDLINSGGVVEIIFSGEYPQESIKTIKDTGVFVYHLKRREYAPFAVVDGKHLALQQYSYEPGKNEVTRTLYYDTLVAAESERDFFHLKTQSRQL